MIYEIESARLLLSYQIDLISVLGEKNNVCWPERLIEFQYGSVIVFLVNQNFPNILVSDATAANLATNCRQ